jgi:glycosyltransferase involved in cell wall biosynthesis
MKEVISRFRIKGKKVILCLGRIHEGKGFQYVIKSLPSVLEKDNQAHLVVAGEDDGFGYSDELSRFVDEYDVKSHVSFVGRVTDEEEKNALLWQASAIAIPSLEEAFGLVAVEAMGSGRLIVASRVGGLSEVLAKDEYTQLFEAGDVKALTDALIYALRNTDLQAKARANRFSRFGEFNMFRMTESYFNLYVSIINKSAKASKE